MGYFEQTTERYYLKKDVELKTLYNFGYKYTGNYNRGDMYEKKIEELKDKGDGILVDFSKRIIFMHPYADIAYPDIKPFIKDLIDADLVEEK